MNTTKTPILSILALLNSTPVPTISMWEDPSPVPLSAPVYCRALYAGRHHAHVSVELDGAHVVLEPHGRHGRRGHELHVVEHGGQQRHGPQGRPWSPPRFSKALIDQENSERGLVAHPSAASPVRLLLALAACPMGSS